MSVVAASLRSVATAATNDFKCIKISSVTAAKTTTKPRTVDRKGMRSAVYGVKGARGKGRGAGCKKKLWQQPSSFCPRKWCEWGDWEAC